MDRPRGWFNITYKNFDQDATSALSNLVLRFTNGQTYARKHVTPFNPLVRVW